MRLFPRLSRRPPTRTSRPRGLAIPLIVAALALILAFVAFLGVRSAYRSHVGRPPDQIHLSWVEDPATTMTAIWRTRLTETSSLIQYRPLGEDLWRMEVGNPRPSTTRGLLHEVTLHNLTPDTTYEYRIKGDRYNRVWSKVHQFHTASNELTDFDVIYVADTGLAGRRDGLAIGTQKVVNEIAKLKPFLVLGGGDYAYYNTDKRYGSLENSVDAWFNQMMPITTEAPIMPAYGNHETLLQENYGLWVERFATPEGFDHRRNYSFDVDNVHFISLFAIYEEQGIDPEALEWLEQDIKSAQAAGRQWIIPFMHVSAFAEGASHPSNLALREQLGPLFEELGIKLVLSSHDQAYERTYPLVAVPESNTPTSKGKSCYTLDDGTTWLKSSPGGKHSNKSKDFSIFREDPSPWVAVRNNTMHVFTRLHFSASGDLKVETFGVQGEGKPPVVVDSFSYTTGTCSA